MRSRELIVQSLVARRLHLGEERARRLLRVQHGRVIELLEGVHEQLPVAADDGAIVEALRHLLERIAFDRGDHRPEELAERLLRLRGEVHEEESRPDVAVHRDQPVAGLVELEELALLLHERARAVELVAPAVVLAHELSAAPARLLARKSVHTSLLPRWRQMLWNARTCPSLPRTTTIDVFANASSLVK
jgi:hypothetical protein